MILSMNSGVQGNHAPVTPGKAQRTYASLAAATATEIAENGSFTAERVAARAGTSVATFYAHFSSKDGALVAAFARVMDELTALVERELSLERLLDEGLGNLCRSFVEAGVGLFREHALVFRVALARVPESRPLRDVYRQHERAAHDRYRRFVELGQAAGRVRPGDPEALALALLVLTEGLNNPRLLGASDATAGSSAASSGLGEIARALERLLAP
jgi:AcrR family transcriptional regulator